MEEKRTRKDWIKNFAIIFLSILLVLTFFSNTIRNFSLPEVAAQYTYSGSITNKVRGQGTISSQDPYSVIYKQTRKVASVNVRVGDEVEAGDVLYYLEEGESEELEAARKTLNTLISTYEKSIISDRISSKVTSDVENNGLKDIGTYQAKIESYNKKIESYQKEIDYCDEMLELWDENNNLTSTAPEFEMIKKYKEEIKGLERAKGALVDSDPQYEDKKSSLQSQINYYTDKIDSMDARLKQNTANMTVQKNVAVAAQKAVQDELDEYVSTITTQMGLADQLDAIEEQRKVIAELEKDQGIGEIVAPVSGTIISLSRVAGETIETGETIATIQIAGKGFSLEMQVTNEQAALISVGDEAEITNSWWYSEVHARVTSIRPNPSSPQSGKIVMFEVEGDVQNGQNLSLTVGKRTSNYDNIVPNSAIREDNKGKFVYRIVSKSTPLGTRYSVERVDIKVLAEDETQSAVSGALESWDYILTTSSKPVTDGQLVRLKNN